MDSSDLLNNRRKSTRNRVYRCLYDSPVPLSKQEVAARLSLSLPTVYQNITELLQLGLIEFSGAQPSRGGRPAMQLQVVAGARFAIGAFISRSRIYLALTNLMCGILAYKELSHSLELFTDEYNAFMASEIENFIDENAVDREKLLGVGICLSGIISEETNTVFYAPTLHLKNVSLQSLIDAIPYPVHPENDANSGGFAEWFVKADGDSLAYFSLAEGVGGALFINGDKYLGTNHRCGEFGHMCVEPGGLSCACGKKGCLEAYCSTQRLSTELGLSLREFFERLRDGDEAAGLIWEDYLRHLAIGIHNIRMALDCRVVLGGMMIEFLGPYFPRLCSLVAELDPFNEVSSYLSLGHYFGKGAILGTALHFVKDFLESSI